PAGAGVIEATVEGQEQSEDVPGERCGCHPVVGIGASAGGLEAMQKLLGAMPANSGMCFVIVQHLDPTQESRLAQVLSRHTTMPVVQIEDGQRVEPDRVFVIRPDATLTLEKGVLRLGKPEEP